MTRSTDILMGEPCDICGDMGVLEALSTCSKCKIAREHFYCRKPFTDDVPALWLCEACELPETSILDPSAMVDQVNTCSAGCSKLPTDSRERGRFKWEKTVKTGKVRYMPAHEAIKLSCVAKEIASPSKRNLHSSSLPSKCVASMSARTPIKPKEVSPKPLYNVRANPSTVPTDLLLPRHRNNQINSVVKQQVVQTSKDPKGVAIAVSEKKAVLSPKKEQIHKEKPFETLMPAMGTESASTKEEKKVVKVSFPSSPPRKKHILKGKLIDTLMPAVEIESASTKKGMKVIEGSFASSPVMHFPRIISSGGNGCTNVESKRFDAKDGGLVTVLPKAEERFRGPALDSSWKGMFEVLDTITHKELNDGFQAHPPSRVRRKVYEFSKKMPRVLHFKMLPRYRIWTEIFQGEHPVEDDIGLYFFSRNSQRSASYSFLLDFIETQDFVMRSYIDGVELLMFSSKHLSSKSQRWNEKYFLWGVFRRVKKHEAECKLPSYSTRNDYDVGDDTAVDMEIDMAAGKDIGRVDRAIFSAKSSIRHVKKHEAECKLPSYSTSNNYDVGDDTTVDMEIDMAAGKDIGRVDRAIFSAKSSIRGCGSTRKENAATSSLHGSDSKIPAVPKKMNFAIPQPLPKVKKELHVDIRPSFEGASIGWKPRKNCVQ